MIDAEKLAFPLRNLHLLEVGELVWDGHHGFVCIPVPTGQGEDLCQKWVKFEVPHDVLPH